MSLAGWSQLELEADMCTIAGDFGGGKRAMEVIRANLCGSTRGGGGHDDDGFEVKKWLIGGSEWKCKRTT